MSFIFYIYINICYVTNYFCVVFVIHVHSSHLRTLTRVNDRYITTLLNNWKSLWRNEHLYASFIYIYIFIYIYVCVCACVSRTLTDMVQNTVFDPRWYCTMRKSRLVRFDHMFAGAFLAGANKIMRGECSLYNSSFFTLLFSRLHLNMLRQDPKLKALLSFSFIDQLEYHGPINQKYTFLWFSFPRST